MIILLCGIQGFIISVYYRFPITLYAKPSSGLQKACPYPIRKTIFRVAKSLPTSRTGFDIYQFEMPA